MWTSLSLNLAGPAWKLSAHSDGFLKRASERAQLFRGLEPRRVETSPYTNGLLFSRLGKLSLHGTHPRISLLPQPKLCCFLKSQRHRNKLYHLPLHLQRSIKAIHAAPGCLRPADHRNLRDELLPGCSKVTKLDLISKPSSMASENWLPFLPLG